jgi:hypothetical protein
VQYYRTLDRTFAAKPGSRLRIANRSGELTVIGEDREDISIAIQISVDAENQREGDARIDAIRIPITEVDGQVEVGPPEYDEQGGRVVLLGIRIGIGRGAPSINMVARVPRSCAVDAEQRSGPLRITGLGAGLRAESRAGQSQVSEVQGDVVFESRSGTTEIREIEGDLQVESRSGRLEIEDVQGRLTLRSRSGSVIVRDVTGELTLDGRSGRIQLEDVRGPVHVRSHAGAVELRGRIQWPVDIEIHSGSVKLAVTRDSAFFMDAETLHGSIRSELPVDYLERPPAEAPTVRVRTHAGPVRVVAM